MLVDTDLPQNGRSGVKRIYFAVQIEQIRAGFYDGEQWKQANEE
jgi:hypothetical protein